MYQNRIVANSNGTLIQDISAKDANYTDLERLRPGIHADVARDKKQFFKEYLDTCDRVMREGAYEARPVHGFRSLAARLVEFSDNVDIWAAASPDFLKGAYEKNGLKYAIGTAYSTMDPRLLDQGNAVKNHATLRALTELLRQKDQRMIAYVSHKVEEAQLASSYSHGAMYGILIKPDLPLLVDDPRRFIVTPSLDNTEFMRILHELRR